VHKRHKKSYLTPINSHLQTEQDLEIKECNKPDQNKVALNTGTSSLVVWICMPMKRRQKETKEEFMSGDELVEENSWNFQTSAY